MGILQQLRRRISRSRYQKGGINDGLTVVSTGDDCTSFMLEGTDTVRDDEESGISESLSLSLSPHTFFSDEGDAADQLILLHVTDVTSGSDDAASDNEEDDDERDNVRLLSPASPKSEEVASYSFPSYHREEDTILEPSFEVALMHLDGGLALAVDGSSPTNTTTNANANTNGSTQHLGSPQYVTQPCQSYPACRISMGTTDSESSAVPYPHPTKRYDIHGRPFVHIYTEGLTTLHENLTEDNDEEDNVNENQDEPCESGTASSYAHPVLQHQLLSNEELHVIEARWALAKHQLSREGSEGGVSTSNRDTVEI